MSIVNQRDASGRRFFLPDFTEAVSSRRQFADVSMFAAWFWTHALPRAVALPQRSLRSRLLSGVRWPG